MEILLTGGSGFVGRAVREALARRGFRVRLAARPSSARPPALAPGETWATVDLFNPARLAEIARGADAVVHLVGIISETPRQTFEKVHAELTLKVLEAASRAGVSRFIHMSALGARPAARSRYHQTKGAAEQGVRSSGLSWTIFRPSIIYGRDDRFTRLFARIARFSPLVPILGNGAHRIQPIRVDQVARAFVGALEQPETAGRTFDLCGPERLTLVEIIRAVLKATGRRRALIRIPIPIAMAQGAVLERVFPILLGRAPPLNRDQILMLEEDNIGDGAPADAAFGLRRPQFFDGLLACLADPQ